MKPRTLLHVFSTLGVGGPQVRFATLANRMAPHFHNLLFAMDGNYDSTTLYSADASWALLDGPDTRGNILRRVSAYRRSLDTAGPDLLVTYNWGAIEWAVANFGRNCPHIHVVDGFGPEEATRQLPRRVLFRRLALARNTRIVVPSLTLQKIVTDVWRMKPERIAYIPNGIDAARFEAPRDAALASKYGLAPNSLVIGTIAALRKEKNLHRLIDAVAAVSASRPETVLMIAGDGAERRSLEDHAAQQDLADRTIFTGHISDPAPVFRLFDIFALSSDTEQMPMAVLEAMASGLPVASVDVGDVRNMVSDSNKPFVVEKTTDGLTEALLGLAADENLRREIGQANRAHVQSVYSEAEMIRAYEEIFSGPPRRGQ